MKEGRFQVGNKSREEGRIDVGFDCISGFLCNFNAYQNAIELLS